MFILTITYDAGHKHHFVTTVFGKRHTFSFTLHMGAVASPKC